jgi:prepilin-type N-terminal cleavage/methylation domain-containing protein
MIKHQRQPQLKHKSSSDAGFTIIESLVGMLVVAILLAAIAPVLVMSTTVRVQARRIEKATQAAKLFIDGVRSQTISSPIKVLEITRLQTSDPRNLDDTIGDYLITNETMPPPDSNSNDLFCLKKDGSIEPFAASQVGCFDSEYPLDNFYVQAMQLRVQDSKPEDGYRLAIRVYRSDIDFSQPVKTNLSNQQENQTNSEQNVINAALGNKQLPLLEMTADIGGQSTNFRALCQRLGPAQGKNCL